MNNTLIRPGELFRTSWAFYKTHWKVLVGIFALPYIILFVGEIFLQLVHTAASPALLAAVGGILTFVGLIFMVAATPGLVSAIDKLSRNTAEQVRVGMQYRIGFGLFWAFVLVGIIRAFAMGGSVILLIIPGIIFAVYSMFAPIALVVDGQHGLSAFTESFAVVRGRWWATLGRIVLLMLAYAVVFIVLALIELILRHSFGYGLQSAADTIINGGLNGLYIVFFTPFALAFTYNLYTSLRATRTADAPVKTFRNWVITFIVLGALLLLALPVITSILAVALNTAQMKGDQQYQAALQQQMAAGQSTSTIPVTTSNGNLVK